MFFYNVPYHAGKIKSRRKSELAGAETMADMFYLAVVVLYVLRTSFDTTMFQISWPSRYSDFVRILVCIVILIKAGCTHVYSGKKWIICVLSFIAFKFSWLSTGYDFLIDTVLMVIGAAGVPYKKVLKVGFWTGVYVLLLAMMGSFTGCIVDLVYSNTGSIRHSFGILYPTDYAAHIVFLSLIGWVLYKRITAILPVVCTVALAYFVYNYCRAKCGVIILCLLAFSQLCFLLERKWRKKENKAGIVTKLFRAGFMCAQPVCALLMIGMTLLYNEKNSLITQVDHLLTSRLCLGQKAIYTYGIKLFGTAFKMIGSGGSTLTTRHYNFVDSSYVLILVRYGLMVLLAVCVQYVWLQRKAIKAGQQKLMVAVLLVVVHSAIEHHLLELAYNPFLLLTFADLNDETDEISLPLQRASQYISYAVGIVIGVPIVVAFPRIVGYLRTIVDLLYMDLSENRMQFIKMMTAVFFVAVFLVGCIFKILKALILKERVSRRWCAASIALVLILAGGVIYGENIIGKGQEEHQSDIAAYEPIIEMLSMAEGDVGRVYIDHIPEIYIREFDIVSSGVFAPKGVASRKNVTLLVKDSAELCPLIASGYQYSELYNGGAVYTNSEVAKTILEDAGFRFTDYYSRQFNLNLADEASWNGLTMTGDGSLLLRGKAESIACGPWVTIYKGGLQVEYKLRLLANAEDREIILTAEVVSEERQKHWALEEIQSTYFDENGECTYLLNVDLTRDAQRIEFLLYVPDGVELEVKEIRYGKVW